MYDTAYLIGTGAGSARRLPELIAALSPRVGRLITMITPNATRIVSPRELALVPGHRIVESFFDEAILPRPPDGLVLVAPCDFNSLNKLAQGIADNLPLSVVAEAIGRGNRVVVAISVNEPLWRHPRAGESARALRAWGCDVLDPWHNGEALTLAPTEEIIARVAPHLAPRRDG